MSGSHSRSIRRWIPPPNYLLAALLIIGALGFSSGHANSRGASPQTGPFRIGELLTYRVDWRKYSGAAEAELAVVNRENFSGRPSWHFRATLRTLEPARAMYPLNDQIDSYASLDGLPTIRYQQRLREFGKPYESDLEFISPGYAPLGGWTRVIVPPGTRDPLSAIYSLRQVDWRRVAEIRIPVYDGDDLYDMIAEREGSQEIRLSAGEVPATRIAIRLLASGRQVADEHFQIWFARDAAQTPIAFEAQLSVGTVRAELTSNLDARNTSPHETPLNPPARSSRPAEN
jgi:hypothetical protein